MVDRAAGHYAALNCMQIASSRTTTTRCRNATATDDDDEERANDSGR